MPQEPVVRGRILVVDPSRTYRRAAQGILARAGYDVSLACNLDRAAGLLGSRAFDLMVCDYMDEFFERGGRWPVLQMLGALAIPSAPLIVTTSNRRVAVGNADELGVSAILTKPFEASELLDAVARVLNGTTGK